MWDYFCRIYMNETNVKTVKKIKKVVSEPNFIGFDLGKGSCVQTFNGKVKKVKKVVKDESTYDSYDITIQLEEQRTGKISLGVGIDSSSGFFGSVGLGCGIGCPSSLWMTFFGHFIAHMPQFLHFS